MYNTLIKTIVILLIMSGAYVFPAPAAGAPPQYAIGFIDRAALEAPGMLFPDGAVVTGFATISPNGRWVAGTVNDPADIFHNGVYRLDRLTGIAEVIAELAQPGEVAGPFGINDHGALVVLIQPGLMVAYWSDDTGRIDYGSISNMSNAFVGAALNRTLNNNDQVLVVDPLEHGPVLWSPRTGSRVTILPSGTETVRAFSLNDAGTVVGAVLFSDFPATDHRPFIWDAASGLRLLEDIGPATTDFRNTAALGINNRGEIIGAGTELYSTGGTTVLREIGLHWSDEFATPTRLPCKGDFMGVLLINCSPFWITEAGQMFGGEESDEDIRVNYFWDGTEPFLLRELLPDSAQCGVGGGISNDNELIAGCILFDAGGNVVDSGPAILSPAPPPLLLTVTAPASGEEVEAGEVLVEGVATDDVAVVSVTVDGIQAMLTSTGNPDDPNEVAFSVPLVLAPGYHTIIAVATDDEGNTDTRETEVRAIVSDDQPPQVSGVMADPNPVAVNTEVLLTAGINDDATGGSTIVSAYYSIDGANPVPMTADDGAFDASQEAVSAVIPGIGLPGVYEICVVAEDAAGNTSDPVCTLLAVFDPAAGFVTGGGWIDSPPGALVDDPDAVGRANFGFVAKYKKGATVPTGSTEFQFQSGQLNFHSSVYEWLVVAGARARFKGEGTVNGLAGYGFMLTAIDGALPGGNGADKFRIRIQEIASGRLLYDNQPGMNDGADPVTVLSGGSIFIHDGGGSN